MNNILDRFLRYVSYDTQSDENATTTPSTANQLLLANYLIEELKELGAEEVSIDQHGVVMATIPSNVNFAVPPIGFIAHYDTSPDFTGTDVKPQIIKNYSGKDIILNHSSNIVLSIKTFPELLKYQGQDIITTNGLTLLGADDKAGIAEIMSATEYLLQHPEVKHGKVCIAFTPDEEIGKGADHFNINKFGAKWAYTVDGGGIGEIEYENFNAAQIKVTFNGISTHPGYAKGKMVNALLLANQFISKLPNETPANTEGTQGFYHVCGIEGDISSATVTLIIRDFSMDALQARNQLVCSLAKVTTQGTLGTCTTSTTNQYQNMFEVLKGNMHIVEIAKQAMIRIGITPIVHPIRGGTDGANLSFMGLPCPNIFAGGHNFHGPYEFLPVESLYLAEKLILSIIDQTVNYALSQGTELATP